MRAWLFASLVLGSVLLPGCKDNVGGGNTGGTGTVGTIGSLGGSAGSGVGGSAGTGGAGTGGTLGGAGLADAGGVGGAGSVDAGGVGGAASVDAGGVGGAGSVDAGGVGGAASVDAGGVGGAGSGGSPVGGAAGASSGGSTGRGCDTDLSGTWDLVATSMNGRTRTGSVIVAPDSLTITIQAKNTNRLSYSDQGTPTVVWQRTPELIQSIDVTRSPTALSAGSIPLSMGGDWEFSARGMTCKSSVGAAGATASCNVGPTALLWPYEAIPMPAPKVTYTASKTAESPSQFGFLGGEWTGASAASTNGCTMRVERNTIQLGCRTGSVWNGVANLTVGSDCVASGLTTTGYELSARKR